jgi:outer membrane protein TolC
VLEGLVAEALRANPDARAAEASADAARFRIVPARTLPDPFLSFSYQNDGKRFTLGERDMTFLGATLSQPLPWPGKLKLAGEAAEAEARQIGSGALGRARRAIEGRVRRTFYEWEAARELLGVTEERRAALKQIESVVRARYAAGLSAQQDLLRAQAETLRVDDAAAIQEASVAARLAELNRAVGRPQETRIEGAKALELQAGVPELPPVLESLRESSPEVAGTAAAIEAEKFRVALARKEFRPDFVASAGPMYRGDLDPMWQVGLGVSLPIFQGSRQKNRLREAEANLRSSEARLSSVAQELEFRTRERFELLKGTARAAALYRDGVLPVDRLSFEAAVASYRTGSVPFITVLDALNTLYADRATYLGRLADLGKLRVAIDEADVGGAAPMSFPSPASAAANPMAESSGGSTGPMR